VRVMSGGIGCRRDGRCQLDRLAMTLSLLPRPARRCGANRLRTGRTKRPSRSATARIGGPLLLTPSWRGGSRPAAVSPSCLTTDLPERPVRLGRRYWLVAHLGSLRVKEPIQVVAVIEEPDRKGFAYGTLVGHPVSGEEAFIVERRTDGSVWFTVRSATRPPAGRWWVAQPVVMLAQRCYRRRYLRALTGPLESAAREA
jgi:hypothetical protein